MKVIFLDIDGVLNNCATKTKCTISPTESYAGIEKSKLKTLKTIIEHTGAKVVLISTWRLHLYKNDRFDKYMRRRFSDVGVEIFSCVEYIKYRRGGGIKSWLKEHPDVEGWVVLDDEMFLDYNEEICKHLFMTNYYDFDSGLKEEDIEPIEKILNGELVDEDSYENVEETISDEDHNGLSEEKI